jgi:hypothetical protein
MKPLYAVAGAVVSTIVLWIGARLLDIDLVVDPNNSQPAGRIALPFAAGMTLVVSLLGWGARAVLGRFTRHAARIWTGVAGTVLLLSFLPLLSVGASGGTKAALGLMHIAVAAILIPALGRRTAPDYAGAA